MTFDAQVRHDVPARTDSDQPTGPGMVRPLVDMSLLPAGEGPAKVVRAAHRLYEHLIALWAPGIIEAAFDLGVFRVLADGPSTSAELARTLSSDPEATRILLDGLHAYELLERTCPANGVVVYALPEDIRECLLPDSLFSLAGKIGYDRQMAWDAWRNLAGAVRTGALNANGIRQHNQISAREYESLVRGINFWAPPVVHALAHQLCEWGWNPERPATMLDVGCGTGIYSQLLLAEFGQLTAVGVDVARILPLAIRQSEQLGVAARFRPAQLDFSQDDWGSGFDLVLFGNIFHLQTPAGAGDLAAKASKALADGGLVAIVDQIVDEGAEPGSTQDRFFRMFAVSMMATGGGDAYTLTLYDEWLASAGLRRLALLNTPMHRVLLAGRA